MLWFSSGTKSPRLVLGNDPDLAQSSCFVTTKYSWKCPGISLKTFNFVFKNETGNISVSQLTYPVWSPETQLEMSRGLFKNIELSHQKQRQKCSDISSNIRFAPNMTVGVQTFVKTTCFFHNKSWMKISWCLLSGFVGMNTNVGWKHLVYCLKHRSERPNVFLTLTNSWITISKLHSLD